MVEISIRHDVLHNVFVFFREIGVNRFHEAREFAVQRLDLLLTDRQQALIVKEKVLRRILGQPLLLERSLYLLVPHPLLVGIAEVKLGFNDDPILNESLVLFIEDGGTDLDLVEAELFVIGALALFLAMPLLLLILTEIYLRLR